MRILLSAYACEPNKGSEPGVGWHWAIELARLGYEVWVITRANNQPAIEQVLKDKSISNLHFVYYDLPVWVRWWKKSAGGVYLYYLLWQWGAYQSAKTLTEQVTFDWIHHITFGVFRLPSFMVFLNVPFIFGPLGGGENTPYALRKSFPVRGYITDLLRDASNWLARIDPITRYTYNLSDLILCKTQETLLSVPKKYQNKCRLYLEIGIDAAPKFRQNRQENMPRDQEKFQVLYVGRLIYWKGLHLGLKAFAKFYTEMPNSQLTIIGSGADSDWLKKIAEQLGINDAIDWIPWMAQTEVMQYYAQHDVFLFPSLHDSSGNVVLEALSQGLPIICLDLGGPAVIVNNSCGRVINTNSSSETEVIQGLSQALKELATNPELQTQLSQGAIARSQTYHWDQIVSQLYKAVEK